jgi:RNA polymerase sigma factor (sigma-70 family)
MSKYDTRDNPSRLSFTEFYTKYDYIVIAVIRRYIPRELGDPEDLSQEIWRQFIEGKEGKSYLQIFDPAVASPTTFMWEFTRTRCLQFLSRSERTPTAKAYSIQNQDREQFQVGIVDPETTHELGFDEFRQVEFTDLLRRAEAAIRQQKIRGRRDLRWVWYLVTKGYRQDQIAQEMGLSEGTISICMDKIREIPEVQELRSWGAENGLLRNSSHSRL